MCCEFWMYFNLIYCVDAYVISFHTKPSTCCFVRQSLSVCSGTDWFLMNASNFRELQLETNQCPKWANQLRAIKSHKKEHLIHALSCLNFPLIALYGYCKLSNHTSTHCRHVFYICLHLLFQWNSFIIWWLTGSTYNKVIFTEKNVTLFQHITLYIFNLFFFFRLALWNSLASLTWKLFCLSVSDFILVFIMRCLMFNQMFDFVKFLKVDLFLSFCSPERLLYLWWFTDHPSSGRMCQVDCIQGTSWSLCSPGVSTVSV